MHMASDYCGQALEYLSYAYDARRAMFSFSTSEGRQGEMINDFAMPHSLRYTINTLLGLSEVERHRGEIGWLGDVGDRVAEFLAKHEHSIQNSGDHGLLLVLLAAANRSHPAVDRSLCRLLRVAARPNVARRLNMQELGWMLWGATAWKERRDGQVLAVRVFDVIRTRFVNQASGMPRHCLRPYRAHIVSFGSIVYFLRAMYEYDRAFGSEVARRLFMRCLERVLAFQLEDGAWPWMIDARSGVPIDVYPIFSVHQDSMAMLFLFPAESYGIRGVDARIERSFMWNLGENELGVSMLRSAPCAWFYRSIERDARWPRIRRYLRTVGPPGRHQPARSEGVRLNRECRSYHLGWVLYAWAGREERLARDAMGALRMRGGLGEGVPMPHSGGTRPSR